MKVENLIDNWIDWLLKEKRLSLNTTHAYRRDMSSFSKFLKAEPNLFDKNDAVAITNTLIALFFLASLITDLILE